MQEAMIDPGKRLVQKSVSAGGRWPWFFIGKRPDEVGSAHDADDPSVAEHGYPLYPVLCQQSCNLADLRVLADGNHWPRHNVTCLTVRGAQACDKIGVER